MDVDGSSGVEAVGREGGTGRFAAVEAVADGGVDWRGGEGVLDGFAEAGACGVGLGWCWGGIFWCHGGRLDLGWFNGSLGVAQ